MQCFPIYSVLKAIGNPKIDYFSLDIEGAELQVTYNILMGDMIYSSKQRIFYITQMSRIMFYLGLADDSMGFGRYKLIWNRVGTWND